MPIHIHIGIGASNTNNAVNNPKNTQEDNPVFQDETAIKTKNSSVDTQYVVQKRMMKAALIGSARQIGNTATSNLGKYTGNSRLQANINKIMEATNIGMTFAQTSAIAGPVVASVVTGTQVITNLVQTASDTAYEIAMSRRESRRALQRAGYSSQNEMLGFRR